MGKELILNPIILNMRDLIVIFQRKDIVLKNVLTIQQDWIIWKHI